MVIGKHDLIARAAARRVAEELGQTLVAPVVSYVPEGEYDPPTGNMRFPGTIGIPVSVFAGTLDGIARSLKRAGFTTICFMSEHGQSQEPQASVVEKLNREWAGSVRVLAVGEYYADAAQRAWLSEQGVPAAAVGDHAGLIDTAELMFVSPAGVNLAAFPKSGTWLTEPTGASGEPTRASERLGEQLLQIRVEAAVRQIRAALASSKG